MVKRSLLVFAVIAAVACVYVSDEKVAELMERVEFIRNQLDDFTNQTLDDPVKEIVDNVNLDVSRAVNRGFLCALCLSGATVLFNLRRVRKQSDEELKALVLRLCVDLNIQSREVCYGAIEFNFPHILYIVDNRPDLTPDTVCKVEFNEGYCSLPYYDKKIDFSVQVDKGESTKKTLEVAPQGKSSENFTIVHITDIHYDQEYKKGSLAACQNYACCRDSNGTENSQSSAGHWGDYRSCDSPWGAVADAFDQIKRQHSKIDAIYFTGDIVDHFMWDVSVIAMKNEIEKVYSLMRMSFGDIPMYPILGNHESQNIFPGPEIEDPSLSAQWLYDFVAELWKNTLPSDALETVKKGGYYTTLIRPGLRLIALNDNVCLIYNWWVLYGSESIRNQFQWFHDTLLKAESMGEKVHILAHVPSGDESYHQPCSREFRKIVDRFYNTIAAQFNGHTEYFGFRVYYKDNKDVPVSVAWNGGSIATFSQVNRNYVVYDIDPEGYHVTNVEAWIYNLTAANLNASENPIWFRQFSFREEFNLPNLSPSTLSEFTLNLPNNNSAIQQLWTMKIRGSDLLLGQGCDRNCYFDVLCEILITDNFDRRKCEQIKWRVRPRRRQTTRRRRP